MKRNTQMQRQSRTRTLIQVGGILQKSGLMDAFVIEMGEDLQSPESLFKAARLLGFLNFCLETHSFSEENVQEWEHVGERLLRYR